MSFSFISNSMVQLITLLSIVKLLAQAHNSCTRGKLVYERIPGHKIDFGFDEHKFADHTDPSIVISECTEMCRNDRLHTGDVNPCTKFNFKTLSSKTRQKDVDELWRDSVCSFSTNAAQISNKDKIVRDPSFDHFVEICANETEVILQNCPNKTHIFTRIPGITFTPGNMKKVRGIKSRQECENSCLRETEFQCRSANYDSSTNGCTLSAYTLRMKAGPDVVKENKNYDYLENNCLKGENRCEGIARIIKEENKEMIKNRDLMSLHNIGEDECGRICRDDKGELPFLCHSFHYNPLEKLCLLSEDYFSEENNNIISSQTLSYHEVVCIQGGDPTEWNRKSDNEITRSFGDSQNSSHDTAFELYRNYVIDSHFYSSYKDYELGRCLDECLHSENKTCKSIIYNPRTWECRMSGRNKHESRLLFDKRFNYYENSLFSKSTKRHNHSIHDDEKQPNDFRRYLHKPSEPRRPIANTDKIGSSGGGYYSNYDGAYRPSNYGNRDRGESHQNGGFNWNKNDRGGNRGGEHGYYGNDKRKWDNEQEHGSERYPSKGSGGRFDGSEHPQWNKHGSRYDGDRNSGSWNNHNNQNLSPNFEERPWSNSQHHTYKHQESGISTDKSWSNSVSFNSQKEKGGAGYHWSTGNGIVINKNGEKRLNGKWVPAHSRNTLPNRNNNHWYNDHNKHGDWAHPNPHHDFSGGNNHANKKRPNSSKYPQKGHGGSLNFPTSGGHHGDSHHTSSIGSGYGESHDHSIGSSFPSHSSQEHKGSKGHSSGNKGSSHDQSSVGKEHGGVSSSYGHRHQEGSYGSSSHGNNYGNSQDSSSYGGGHGSSHGGNHKVPQDSSSFGSGFQSSHGLSSNEGSYENSQSTLSFDSNHHSSHGSASHESNYGTSSFGSNHKGTFGSSSHNAGNGNSQGYGGSKGSSSHNGSHGRPFESSQGSSHGSVTTGGSKGSSHGSGISGGSKGSSHESSTFGGSHGSSHGSSSFGDSHSSSVESSSFGGSHGSSHGSSLYGGGHGSAHGTSSSFDSGTHGSSSFGGSQSDSHGASSFGSSHGSSSKFEGSSQGSGHKGGHGTGLSGNTVRRPRCDPGSDTFSQARSRTQLRPQHIQQKETVSSLEECEEFCLRAKNFQCRSFNFISGFTPTVAENCELSNLDARKLDLNDPNFFTISDLHDFYFREPNSDECLDVSQTCTESEMVFTLRTPTGFRGRIYTFRHYDRNQCFIRGDGGNVHVLRIPGVNSFPNCGTENYGNTQTNIVIVQHSEIVQTSRDIIYNLTCTVQDPGEAVVSSGYIGSTYIGGNIGGEGGSGGNGSYEEGGNAGEWGFGRPIPIEYLPAEHTLDSRVRLVISYQGRPTTTIAVGDPLEFKIETQDGYNLIRDIFATNVIAKDPYSQRSVRLIDNRGCPLDPDVFPALGLSRSGDGLITYFNAFKIPESNFLVFEAKIRTCRGGCPPVDCHGPRGREISYGKRKRRDVEENNSTDIESNTDEKNEDIAVREMFKVMDTRDEIFEPGEGSRIKAAKVAPNSCVDQTAYISLLATIFILLAILAGGIIYVLIRLKKSKVVKETTDYDTPPKRSREPENKSFGNQFKRSRMTYLPNENNKRDESQRFQDPSEPIYTDPSLFEKNRNHRS